MLRSVEVGFFCVDLCFRNYGLERVFVELLRLVFRISNEYKFGDIFVRFFFVEVVVDVLIFMGIEGEILFDGIILR